MIAMIMTEQFATRSVFSLNLHYVSFNSLKKQRDTSQKMYFIIRVTRFSTFKFTLWTALTISRLRTYRSKKESLIITQMKLQLLPSS